MKLRNRLVVILALFARSFGFCQQPPTPPPQAAPAPASPEPELTKFNLDFPGGTPKELVAAIQKATGKPLNAIINADLSAIQLPPLKMTGVNVDTRSFPAQLVVASQPCVFIVRTRDNVLPIRLLSDQELLAMVDSRSAVLVRRGPDSAELIFVNPEDRKRFPLN